MPDAPDTRSILEPAAWHDAPEGVLARLRAQSEGDIIIDAAQAPSVDAQIAQLLLSARKTAQARDCDLQITNASDPFVSSLRTLGLLEALEGAIE